MTYIIRIDVDGSVTEHPGHDLLAVAREHFDGMTSTFTCHPIYGPEVPDVFPAFGHYLVGVCHDLAYHQPEATVNLKAWALYGRSPLAGPVFMARDLGPDPLRPPLPQRWIEQVRGFDWLVDGIMLIGHMRELVRDAGLLWPEWNADGTIGHDELTLQDHLRLEQPHPEEVADEAFLRESGE